MCPKPRSSAIRCAPEEFEYFEFRPSWLKEWVSEACCAREWRRRFPDQFKNYSNRKGPGRAGSFFQYALQFVLRRDYDIKSVAWMHMECVEPSAPESQTLVARGKTGRDHEPRWNVMRKYMKRDFDRLQSALFNFKVAGKRGETGEPDLFCFRESETDRLWCFAEAKSLADDHHDKQERWFAVAENTLGVKRRPFLCRVVPEGYVRPLGCPKHTGRWNEMMTST